MRYQRQNEREVSKSSELPQFIYESKIGSSKPKTQLIYASRTHSQLNQVVNAAKNIKWEDYNPKVIVIASRDHL